MGTLTFGSKFECTEKLEDATSQSKKGYHARWT